jgi:GTP pyrophosphokinase
LVKGYNPKANANLLRKAYIFAMEAHGVQKRASGAPYFYHPLEVARFLAELKLDVATVVTGLLHDILEDTKVSFEELEEIFGAEVALLVEGVTKLSKISYMATEIHPAENFQKFIFATSHDIRILVVKLVDRLNNMRTINHIVSIAKRKKIALETLEIYAPLAECIGMNIIKDEIEDLAFYNLHPEEYSAIALKLEKIRNKDSDFVFDTKSELEKVFKDAGINASISGREKKIYSIWKKMQKRNISFEQINDIIAFRVVVSTIQQCYLSLGIIHTHFQVVPGRFKDYISIPKLNNYRSLHTSVIGQRHQAIEIQIRTEEMHRVADEGVAAHWSYKNGDVIAEKDNSRNNVWIKSIISIIQTAGSPEEIMNYSKLEMFENRVFCFTPRGNLIILPYGATAIDFAYGIHTIIGNTCVGAKINGKMASLRTALKNGDQIDVITSPYQHPQAIWENFAVTGKAKSNIKKIIKAREKIEFTMLGLRLSKYIFSLKNICFNEDLIDPQKNSCSSLDKFYFNVGKGIISLNRIRNIFPKSENQVDVYENYLYLSGLTPGVAVHFADCCHPILGDRVISVLVPQTGIVIHTTSCSCIAKNEYDFIKVKWNQNDETDPSFIARLQIVIENKTEGFSLITNIISSNNANITNLKVEHRGIDFFSLLVDVKLKDSIHLGEILAALWMCPAVRSVKRI